MISLRKDCLTQIYSKICFINNPCFFYHYKCLPSSSFRFFIPLTNYSVISSLCNLLINSFKFGHILAQKRRYPVPILPSIENFRGGFSGCLCSFYSTRAPSRSFRRRQSKRLKASRKPVLDVTKFQEAIGKLPPRFNNDELFNVLTLEEDTLVCFEIFNWASHQHRFRHDTSTYHVIIKKLGVAKMYQEMDDVVNQVLAIPHIGNEALYNSIIYFFTEARKLNRAVNIFNHMRNGRNLEYRPLIRTYNILFTALLSRGKNSYINYVYMESIRSLFKQMVNDGIEPDIYSLNSMIKGYVLSLHVNDALRIFHQMGVVYPCLPNSFSYDYLIHGLCAQGRTNNARELCDEMKSKGFDPSSKSYNSLVNALALAGEVDEALNCFWEMIQKHKSPDFITYRTLMDEMCRHGKASEARNLLKVWGEKRLVDTPTYRKLQCVLEDDFENSNDTVN